jgi:hypothetical protein
MQVRLSSSTPKLGDNAESRWLTTKMPNTPISNRRRSILRVISIIGKDSNDTTQAYTVSMTPTSAGERSKLLPMALSKPTGTNSVVLKMNAARARAITQSQLPASRSLSGVW